MKTRSQASKTEPGFYKCTWHSFHLEMRKTRSFSITESRSAPLQHRAIPLPEMGPGSSVPVPNRAGTGGTRVAARSPHRGSSAGST